MDKKKLKIARNKIDQLDSSIFNLIKQRTKIVEYMLSLKQFKNQIVDQKRIDEILKNIRKKSIIDLKNKNLEKSVLRLKFEDFIFSYEDCVQKVVEYTGITTNHIFQKRYFSPDIAAQKVGLWKKYPNQSVISDIYEELKDSCYNRN